VSTPLAVLLLALVTIGWFTLALLPALGELFGRGDVEPLQLRRGGGDVRHFALGFQRFVDAELAALASSAERVPATGHAVTLRDGEPAWHLPARHAAIGLPLRLMPPDALTTHVVLSEEELSVPNDCSLLKELYVARDLRGGNDCFYRAVLARGHASLGARSGVLRWIDAGEVLIVGEGSVLYGRASATLEMRLYDGVSFQRVASPRISFGTPGGARMATPPQGLARITPDSALVPLEPPEGVSESFGRWMVEGDFEVPAATRVPADLVVTGTLRVGAGARLGGAVKSAVIEAAPGVIWDGAIVATTRLELGAGSAVAGPIVVEGAAIIGAASRIGTVADPTTISAVTVQVGRGSVVYGEVWARESGEVEGAPMRRMLSSGGWETIT
jgi:hypothetical protein